MNIRATVAALGAALAIAIAGASPAVANDKVVLCHAAGLDGTTHYVTLEVGWPAAYGPAGHFYENGTPQAGHEQDYLGPCSEQPTPTPSPSVSPSPQPTPSPSTSPTPDPTSSPAPTPRTTLPPTDTVGGEPPDLDFIGSLDKLLFTLMFGGVIAWCLLFVLMHLRFPGDR